MSDIKNKVRESWSNVKPRDIRTALEKPVISIEHLIGIISNDANQLQYGHQKELHFKLEEFAVNSDTIEEVHENKEQIEISRVLPKLPNSANLATENSKVKATTFRYIDAATLKMFLSYKGQP